MRPVRLVLAALAAVVLPVPAAHAVPLPLPSGSIWLLSGTPGLDAGLPREVNTSWSGTGAVSADGRYVAFASRADGLLPGSAGHAAQQIYRKDRQTGEIRLMSVTSDGTPVRDDCDLPRISADGSAVAFACQGDVYLRRPNRRDIYETVLVTPGTPTEVGGFDLSADGSAVAVAVRDDLDPADTNEQTDVYVRRLGLLGDSWRLVSRRNETTPAPGHGADSPAISDDGTVVAYRATGLSLVNGPADTSTHVFRTMIGPTSLSTAVVDAKGATIGDANASEPDISGDGTAVAFSSQAANLGDADARPDVFVWDAGTLRVASTAEDFAHWPSLDATGNAVVFTTSYAGVWRQQATASPTQLTVPAEAGDANAMARYGASVSGDATVLAFTSTAERTGDVDPDEQAVFAMQDGLTDLVSRPPGVDPFLSTTRGARVTQRQQLSADGTRALFLADRGGFGRYASIAVVRDVPSGTPLAASRADGATGDIDAAVADAAISPDGRVVAFVTATRVDPARDADTTQDVYLREVDTGRTQLVSVRDDGSPFTAAATAPSLSQDGSRVMFAVGAELHVRDLASGRTHRVSAQGTPGRITADGRLVVFTSTMPLTQDDDDLDSDVFQRDLATGRTELLSADVEPGVLATDPVPSSSGRKVALRTLDSASHTRVRVYDAEMRTTSAPIGEHILSFDLSGNGRALALWTTDDLGVPNRTDDQGRVVVVDVGSGAARVGVTEPGGLPAAVDSGGFLRLALSGGGDCLLFPTGGAPALVPGGTSPDVFEIYLTALTPSCGNAPAAPDRLDAPPSQPEATPPTTLPVPVPVPVVSQAQGRGADRTAPRVSGLRRSSSRLKRRESMTLRLVLDEPATVRVVYERCVRSTRGRCTRWRAVGTITRKAAAGKVTMKLTARLGRRTLAAGRYRLAVTAADAAGNRSRAQHRTLTVVRG